MKGNVTKKALLTLGLICVLLAMVPAVAFSWGDATHVYISDRLKARGGYYNLNEMWGSLGPDIFNFIFDDTLCPLWLAEQTHGTTAPDSFDPDSFMKVWNVASTTSEKALAYGFVSHNEVWGADFTAHIHGLTVGQDKGYINAKAMILLDTPLDPTQPYHPTDNPTFAEVFAGIGASPEQQLIIAHVIAEYAIDIMLKNHVDHLLGEKVKLAARFRSPQFPALLVDAYAADYAENCSGIDYLTAAAIITYAEAEYRRNMISYGQAISRAESIAVQLIAEQIVVLAPGFLGGELPDLEVDPAELVKAAIYGSMAICHDYMTEINATIEFVEDNLTDNGIIY
jgi:hypothetical protein